MFKNPVQFCNHQCILLLLNFEVSLHLFVENEFSGIFSVQPNNFADFVPLPSRSLISHTLKKPNSDLIPQVEAKLVDVLKLENARLDSRFQCPDFSTLKVNDFLRKSFDFDVHSVAFHYTSPHLVRKFFPKALFPKSKMKLISYQQYNKI